MYSDADSSFQESNTSRNSTLTGRRGGPGVSIAQTLLRPARNRAPRTTSGTGVTTPLLRRPPSTPAGPRYAKSFATLAKEDLDRAEVFGIIHRIRRDLKKCIETALTYEQANSPRLVFSVMRPLQDAYMRLNSPCTIYALFINRVYFASQTYTLSSLSVNNTRAMVCEILAIKILRALYEADPSEDGIFKLATILASSWSPFQGAPEWCIPNDLRQHAAPGISAGIGMSAAAAAFPYGERLTGAHALALESDHRKIASSALELAIVSESKRFIRAVPTQKVILAIWRGKIVYSSMSFRYLIKDVYKKRQIMKYGVENAPLLDHYRLRVPRIRAALEWLHFAILFTAYLAVLRTMQKHTMNGYEIFWVVYGFGFALDKFASLMELGWTIFNQNLWNGLDFVFVLMFLVYLPLRVVGLKVDHDAAAVEALSILTCCGVVLFPRFAFTTLSDNLLILSLRSMLAQFGRLMVLAVWCFAGFFVAFLTLGGGKYGPWEVMQWMVWIWFGLDATGLIKAAHLHNILGPTLMVIYACLSNTLLVTVLVSILSNTFNAINKDAIAEQMYRRAVSTFHGNKSDGIFSFQPPINILALVFLWPLRFVVDAHTYHSVIVFFARATNLPLLLLIRLVERYVLFREDVKHAGHERNDYAYVHGNESLEHPARPAMHRSRKRADAGTGGLLASLGLPETGWWWQGTRTDINAVFECEEELAEDYLPESVFAGEGQSRAASPEPMRAEHGNGNGNEDEQDQQPHGALAAAQQRADAQAEAVLQHKKKRRTHSMSDWGGTLASSGRSGGGSTIKAARPTILSKLYAQRNDSFLGEQRERRLGASTPARAQTQTQNAAQVQVQAGLQTVLQRDALEDIKESWRQFFAENANAYANASAGAYGSLGAAGADGSGNTAGGAAASADDVQELRERLERIEEGQKRIEEALKGLGGGDD